MSTKSTPVKKVSAAKAKQSESVVELAPPVQLAPVVEVVAAPPPPAEATKPKKVRAKKETAAAPAEEAAPVAVAPVVAAPIVAAVVPAASTLASVEAASDVAEDDEKRMRPKLRAFNDIYSELSTSVSESYNLLQSAKRGLKSLQSAHNREVHNNTKTRESATRTPTIVFDQELVTYFRKRLPAALLKVTRKGEEFDLSGLNTETRVHRTDVTQLYTAVFKHHKMQNPDDRRNVLYMQDPDLMSLLTSGDLAADLLDDVKQIKEGNYKLTIFNIQRFTNQHLGKVALSLQSVASEEALNA
jgi:hypothetical protein